MNTNQAESSVNIQRRTAQNILYRTAAAAAAVLRQPITEL